jgi:hypothetical protein
MLALSLSCVPPAQVSVAGIRLDPNRSMRYFKGIVYVDISEFESTCPSYPDASDVEDPK